MLRCLSSNLSCHELSKSWRECQRCDYKSYNPWVNESTVVGEKSCFIVSIGNKSLNLVNLLQINQQKKSPNKVHTASLGLIYCFTVALLSSEIFYANFLLGFTNV